MNISKVSSSVLFRGMTKEQIKTALEQLGAHEKYYSKGQAILHSGQMTGEMGIVLEGSVLIENYDLWGNRTILTMAGTGDFFAEVYAVIGDTPLLIDVSANEDCRILFMGIRVPQVERTKAWYVSFLQNLLLISSGKNLTLSGRAFHTSPRTIRGRIMAYLDTVSVRKHSREFDIPFDRQQMADYLNVDRTALSKELSRMQKEGLISFKKNHFLILGAPGS